MKEQEKHYESYLDIRNIIPWITVIFFLGFLILVVLTYRSFLMSLLISTVLYILFLKPYHFIFQKSGNRKTMASLFTTILMILTIVIPAILIIINLIQEITIALTLIKKYVYHMDIMDIKTNKFMAELITSMGLTDANLYEIQSRIILNAQEMGIYILKNLRYVFTDITRFLVNFIISIFVLFFFFRNGDDIGNIIYKNFPFPENMKSQVVTRMIDVFNAVVKGNIIIAFAQGLVVGLLFWIFQLPTPILYGVIGVFFGLIPVIGTNILWMPAAVYLYTHGNETQSFIFGSIAFIAYLTLENLAKPLLLDKELKLHPLLLLLSLLGGLTEFGIKGLIIGPFSITIFLTLWQLVKIWNVNHGIIKE